METYISSLSKQNSVRYSDVHFLPVQIPPGFVAKRHTSAEIF